ATRDRGEHERQRRLLRQRDDGKLLGHAQDRAGASAALRDTRAGEGIDLRVCRGVLQSPTTAQFTRLREPRNVRGRRVNNINQRPRNVGKSILSLRSLSL